MFLIFGLFVFLITGCISRVTETPALVPVTIDDQGKLIKVEVKTGESISTAITKAGLTLSILDRSDPPTFTRLTNAQTVQIIRVKEEFYTENQIIPFDHQTVRNETLPEGQKLLIQPGENGTAQITYRRLIENGQEVSRTVFKSEIQTPSTPEIIMIGVQAPFSPLTIPGRLVYINAGSGWLIEGTTGNRRPILASGDFDGRIFSLSPDRAWLLFTRSIHEEGSPDINALWVANLETDPPQVMDLGVRNVIHYAEWDPNSVQTVTYSTVEPRDAPPGWQANNDIHRLVFGSDGTRLSDEELIGPNTGGIYGWWGTTFSWSPDGSQLAYARPDSIGVVDFDNEVLAPWTDIVPFQTRADWAWVPNMNWSNDSQRLVYVNHDAPSGASDPEISTDFSINEINRAAGTQTQRVPNVGMFANPRQTPAGDASGRLAYLEAIFPEQSRTSRYRLMLTGSDGTNPVRLFPPEGSAGLDPQTVVWSPSRSDLGPQYIALVYQGNIWAFNLDNKKSLQITGDGLVGRIDWQ